MSEYRQDDRTLGYCPQCGAVLATVFVDAAGWCPTHGRVWAEWNPPADDGMPSADFIDRTARAMYDALQRNRTTDHDPGDETRNP